VIVCTQTHNRAIAQPPRRTHVHTCISDRERAGVICWCFLQETCTPTIPHTHAHSPTHTHVCSHIYTYVHTQTTEILLSRGADVHIKTNWGSTPLHYASKAGHLRVYVTIYQHSLSHFLSHTHMHARAHSHTHVFHIQDANIYTHKDTHLHTHSYTYTHTYAHTHTHTFANAYMVIYHGNRQLQTHKIIQTPKTFSMQALAHKSIPTILIF